MARKSRIVSAAKSSKRPLRKRVADSGAVPDRLVGHRHGRRDGSQSADARALRRVV